MQRDTIASPTLTHRDWLREPASCRAHPRRLQRRCAGSLTSQALHRTQRHWAASTAMGCNGRFRGDRMGDMGERLWLKASLTYAAAANRGATPTATSFRGQPCGVAFVSRVRAP